jgi:hypothetical protein
MTTCRVQYVAGEVASVTLLDPLPSAPDADHPIDWRWVADYKTVKKVIAGRLLGNLATYEARYDRFRPFLRPEAWREEQVPGIW